MRAVHSLAAMPLAAAIAGLLYLAAVTMRALRRVASAWCLLSMPTAAVLAYRLWDHHVGPESFALWRLELTPHRMAFVLPLAALSPFFVLASRRGGVRDGKRSQATSALACFSVAAALTAAMSDHFFLLAGMCALTTWCFISVMVLRGSAAGRSLPWVFPLALSDLCLALGVLFFYRADPTRGLLFPPAPLRPEGAYAAACALMLAAALLRLGMFPTHLWMPEVSRGGRDIILVHVLAVDLSLGAFLLFAVARLVFVWGGAWTWACLGVASISALVVSRELLSAREGGEVTGLLCSSLGAGLALVAAPGGQSALAAMRVGLWAGLSAVALVELGRGATRGGSWFKVVGGASLMGMPPLAGFAWLWLGLSALHGAFSGGTTVLFMACLPLLLAQSWVMGTTSLLVPKDGETTRGEAWLGALGLTAACVVVGLFPGAMIDLLMREYGLPVELPVPGWQSLGAAVLLLSVPAAVLLALWAREKEAPGMSDVMPPMRALPLLAKGRFHGRMFASTEKARVALVACGLLLYIGWAAIMAYLALR
ncbi:MAG: hypothetical protein HPY75_05855 [Actinobacteria bacterium]|nr:hypothetical protein [Actinomycetota bacterium]